MEGRRCADGAKGSCAGASARIDRGQAAAFSLKLTLAAVSATDTKVRPKQTAPRRLEVLTAQPGQDANIPTEQITAR